MVIIVACGLVAAEGSDLLHNAPWPYTIADCAYMQLYSLRLIKWPLSLAYPAFACIRSTHFQIGKGFQHIVLTKFRAMLHSNECSEDTWQLKALQDHGEWMMWMRADCCAEGVCCHFCCEILKCLPHCHHIHWSHRMLHWNLLHMHKTFPCSGKMQPSLKTAMQIASNGLVKA